jgi:DNA polymerase III sliding clamp (beta) subunit (PCNA family)
MNTIIKDTQYTKQTFTPLVSKDSFRPALSGVYVDTIEQKLIATDGHKLVQFPFIPEDGSAVSNIVQPETFPIKKTNFNCITISETSAIRETPERSVTLNTISETYPDYKSVIPNKSHKEAVECIGVDLKLFADLYQSLKTVTGKHVHVKLTFNGENRAIEFETTNTEAEETIKGLIMPMRLDK